MRGVGHNQQCCSVAHTVSVLGDYFGSAQVTMWGW